MKDTDNKMEQKCVKELRKRMNELSSDIDCFDKISARAFPEQDPDFSDSEFIVSDLENVTGKRRTVPVLKWVAAAAAILLCIGILPKTAPFQNFLASISKNKDTDYRMILSEITEETEKNDYDKEEKDNRYDKGPDPGPSYLVYPATDRGQYFSAVI